MKDLTTNITPTNKPTLVVMMGGPGAGKSFIRNREYSNLPVIDCDMFKTEHPDYDPKNITLEIHEFSKVILKREFFRLLSAGESFVYDGTGTNLERYIKWISEAREAGYQIEICYVKCDLPTALKRNRTRERFVSESIVRDKHSTVQISFDILNDYADTTNIINNN